MPFPPLLICAITLSSFTGFPFCSVFRLNSPCNDGPIFFSGESTLWHIVHCSKLSLPLAASPLPFCPVAKPAHRVVHNATAPVTAKTRRIICWFADPPRSRLHLQSTRRAQVKKASLAASPGDSTWPCRSAESRPRLPAWLWQKRADRYSQAESCASRVVQTPRKNPP